MSKIVSVAEKQIIASVTAALKENMASGVFAEAEIPAFKTEIPADKNNGDYSANAAFMLSKALRMPPRKIAEEILNKINLYSCNFRSCIQRHPHLLRRLFCSAGVQAPANEICSNGGIV